MASNKLHKLIEKYNLINIIKVFVLLIILFLIYRIFIEQKQPNLSISNVVMKSNIYEGFQQALLGNGDVYGNIISLNDPTNIPIYLNNTCILKLNNVYRIDTLVVNFNSTHTVNISFLDGNGNTKYIKSSGAISSSGSPPIFELFPLNNTKFTHGPITNITDENDLVVYTSQIIITLTNGNNFDNNTLNSYGIYGGDRNLPFLTDYNTLSNNLSYSDTSFNLHQAKPLNYSDSLDTYVFNQTNDSMIYSLKMDISSNQINADSTLTATNFNSQNDILTESHFNINITYENSIYYNNGFNINTIYYLRNDYLNVDTSTIFIFLTEPIIANRITFTISRISTITKPKQKIMLNITTLKVLDKNPSSTDISDFQKNINILNSANDENDNRTCPNINDLVNTQTQTQQICDTLEYQDKVKSEKIRLERNKQYLLKLQNQQTQIDQLNSVIQDLDHKRQSRAQISDQARVLQYHNQKADASTIRDLANQRLDSQANNQLYLDFNINTH